jgi:hypothetical protein
VYGNGVASVANLKLEGEGRAAEDLEGARIGGGERRVGGGGANENERGGEEFRWQGGGVNLQVAEKGSRNGKIADFVESERNCHQGKKETVQGEQEENQRWLLLEKNWIFHGEWIERKKGIMADGLPSQAYCSEHGVCL